MIQNDKLNGIFGASVGDILGVPVEFMSRKELAHMNSLIKVLLV